MKLIQTETSFQETTVGKYPLSKFVQGSKRVIQTRSGGFSDLLAGWARMKLETAPFSRMHCVKGVCGLLLFFVFCGALNPVSANARERDDIEGHVFDSPAVVAPILVGGMQDFPPYEFLDKDGKPAGFNVDLTRAIANVMEMKVRIELTNWEQARKSLKEGKIDILQGVNYSKVRAREFDFSPPHSMVQFSIWSRLGAPPVGSLADLHGKDVVVLNGSISQDLLVSEGGGYHLVRTRSYGDAIRLLASGKYDYLVAARLPVRSLLSQLHLRDLVAVKNTVSLPYCYAVKKGKLDLLDRFSEGLALIKKTGEYQKIHDRWLGVLDTSRGTPWAKILKYGAIVVVPLLLGLGGTVAWSRILKKQVAQRTAALAVEIAERERAMEELQLRQQQLVQADKMTSLGILVAGVGHEINNPIGGILLGLPILMKAQQMAQTSLDAQYHEHGDFMIGGLRYSAMRDEIPQLFSEMMEGAQRIKRIVEDLKDFARINDPNLTDSVDLNRVVEKSVRLVEHAIKKETDYFSVTYADNLPSVKGSEQRLEQVIVNLILNACQALTKRDQGISLTTSLDGTRGEVRLEVKDEGVGIAKEHLVHLTDPFFTTKRESGGTGLGLSISAGIVKEHGGELRFNSKPGKGTVVTLALPKPREEISA